MSENIAQVNCARCGLNINRPDGCCGVIIRRSNGTADQWGEVFCQGCAVYLDGDEPPKDQMQRLVNVAIAIVDMLDERERAIALERQETGRSGVSFIAMGIKATLLELELRRAVGPFRKAKN